MQVSITKTRKLFASLAILGVLAVGMGIGFVLGLNSKAPDFPVTVSHVSIPPCEADDLTKGKCSEIDWKALNQHLTDQKIALNRPFNVDVKPMDYDALRQAGLLPK
ncbi:MAG: hypothetical protein KAX55_04020 [Propionivibrio sp.]|nr:hypothetical protein [Propionivibrio sp.]